MASSSSRAGKDLANGSIRDRAVYSDRAPIRSELLPDLVLTPRQIFG